MTFDYSLDFEKINFREHPELYRVGKGEQGVLLVEPYKSEILPHWRFKQGFDLKRYFDTATETDLVMIVTGLGAVPFLAGGPVADRHPCNGTDWCAPMSVVNVQMPDALLRQHRDSLVVNFTAGRIRDWSIMVDREVVDGYLRAVDSVTAALKVR